MQKGRILIIVNATSYSLSLRRTIKTSINAAKFTSLPPKVTLLTFSTTLNYWSSSVKVRLPSPLPTFIHTVKLTSPSASSPVLGDDLSVLGDSATEALAGTYLMGAGVKIDNSERHRVLDARVQVFGRVMDEMGFVLQRQVGLGLFFFFFLIFFQFF